MPLRAVRRRAELGERVRARAPSARRAAPRSAAPTPAPSARRSATRPRARGRRRRSGPGRRSGVVISDGSRSWMSSAVRAARSASSRSAVGRSGCSYCAASTQTASASSRTAPASCGACSPGAYLARRVAREHARVADREVDLRHRLLVALHVRQPAAARGREARRLARDGQHVLERLDVLVDPARGLQRALGARRIVVAAARPRSPRACARACRTRSGRPGRPSRPGPAGAGTRPRRGRLRRRSGPPGRGRWRSRWSSARRRRAGSPRSPPR